MILVGAALRQTRRQLGERQIPLMGVLAAFIFAAQMINFPVAGGTSGHLIGGTLTAILLGPWAAVLVMTSVITIQALLFQDGGLLALGFNIFNMGIVNPFIGYSVYQWVGRIIRKPYLETALGAWIGVEAAALCTALQLGFSGTSDLALTLPAMLGVHALIGIGEAFITVGTLVFIGQTRPDLLSAQTGDQRSNWVTVGLIMAVGVVILSPLASTSPDGLERVAIDQGFSHRAEDALYQVLPDYTIPFIENQTLTTIMAGVVGVVVVVAATYVIARFTRRQSATP
jgi:cobalt/nickel transport system permease protein